MSGRTMRGIAFGVVFLLGPVVSSAETASGTVAAGWTWPQKGPARFTDPGPTLCLRVQDEIGETSVLGAWLDLGFVYFQHDVKPVEVNLSNGESFLADQKTNQYAAYIHLGPQIGSHSPLAFFRPRVAVGPGFYVFREEVNLDVPDAEEDVQLDSTILGRLGWRATIGSDFFPTPAWGIAADLVYDRVWHLRQRIGTGSRRVSADFTSFHLGVSTVID